MPSRRRLIACAATLASLGVGVPARAAGAAAILPRMTDGPFYPPPAWRAGRLEADADLTRVAGARAGAEGEHLELAARVVDAGGRPMDGAVVEIWQCDIHGRYRHPGDTGSPVDAGFQGFGVATSARDGTLAFRTIRPAPYSGRTPHIHVKVRHAAVGTVTSQLFVAGDPGNARDFLWRQLDAAGRGAVELRLVRAPAGAGVAWRAMQDLVVG